MGLKFVKTTYWTNSHLTVFCECNIFTELYSHYHYSVLGHFGHPQKKSTFISSHYSSPLLSATESESEVAQSCPTLCDPVDCSPPGSSIHVILQARILGGLPFPSQGDLPDPGIEPRSPASQADALTSEPPGKPNRVITMHQSIFSVSEKVEFLNGNIKRTRKSFSEDWPDPCVRKDFLRIKEKEKNQKEKIDMFFYNLF